MMSTHYAVKVKNQSCGEQMTFRWSSNKNATFESIIRIHQLLTGQQQKQRHEAKLSRLYLA